MKKTALLVSGILVALIAFAGITSGLRIPPGEEFFLGNNYHGSYKASVQNKGMTKVEISTKKVEGQKILIDTVNPGETHEYKLEKDQATVLRNLSRVMRANLLVKTKGDDNLSMYYEKWEKNNQAEIIELTPNQSMCITGKGKGQDAAINPFSDKESIARVENVSNAQFFVRIQNSGEIILNKPVLPTQTQDFSLKPGDELYFDTDEKAKAQVSFSPL